MDKERVCEQAEGRQFLFELCVEEDVLCGDKIRADKLVIFCYLHTVNC